MKNGMKMAAIYARVSTEDQARDGRTSIDVQHAACESEVARRGWKLMVGEYDDPGASGGTLERPGLQRLLRDCRLGLVNAVVVSKIDRVARDEIVRLLLIREFQQMGIDFVALDVPGDYQSAEGELLSGLLGNVAAFERKKIVQRTVEGQRAKAKRGDWPGGTAPYGYSLTGTGPTARPVIDEAEADMLRHATSMVVDQGLSTGEACRVLNGLGLRPRHARAWEHQNLRRVLSSQTLLGRVSWAKSERPHGQGHHTRRLPDGSNKYGATLDLQLPPILDLGRFTAL